MVMAYLVTGKPDGSAADQHDTWQKDNGSFALCASSATCVSTPPVISKL